MDYTKSPDYATHAATGQRMHEDNQATPTVVTDDDINALAWELMSVIKAAGRTPMPFDCNNPESYQQVVGAIKDIAWGFGKKQRPTLFVRTFSDAGAIGDGVVDDSDAIESILNTPHIQFDGEGKTYKVARPIICTKSHVAAKNFILDGSSIIGAVSNTEVKTVYFRGSEGAAVPVMSDVMEGASKITLQTTAGINKGDWLYLGSNASYSKVLGDIKLGQLVYVSSVINTTDVAIGTRIHYNFLASDGAYIKKQNQLVGLNFENCGVVNNNINLKTGFYFESCGRLVFKNPKFYKNDYSAVMLSRCSDSMIVGGEIEEALGVGTGYGVVIARGCYRTRIYDLNGRDTRHLVTLGGSEGVNLKTKIMNCDAEDCRDAGLDAHQAADHTSFLYNNVSLAEVVSGESDGIVHQGGTFQCVGNKVIGFRRYGILAQHMAEDVYSIDINGNETIPRGLAKHSVLVTADSTTGGTKVSSVNIVNNKGEGDFETQIAVYAKTTSIRTMTISGNKYDNPSSVRSVFVVANSAQSIRDFNINGNVFKTIGAENIYLQGVDANSVINGYVGGNVQIGGGIGVRSHNANYVMIAKSQQIGITTAYSATSGGANNTVL